MSLLSKYLTNKAIQRQSGGNKCILVSGRDEDRSTVPIGEIQKWRVARDDGFSESGTRGFEATVIIGISGNHRKLSGESRTLITSCTKSGMSGACIVAG